MSFYLSVGTTVLEKKTVFITEQYPFSRAYVQKTVREKTYFALPRFQKSLLQSYVDACVQQISLLLT